MVGPTSTSLHSDPFPNTDAAIGVRTRNPSRKEAMPPVAVQVQHHNPAVHPIPARRATRTSRALRARADLSADSNSDPPDDNSTANAYPPILFSWAPPARPRPSPIPGHSRPHLLCTSRWLLMALSARSLSWRPYWFLSTF
jgi:hypothetical protein